MDRMAVGWTVEEDVWVFLVGQARSSYFLQLCYPIIIVACRLEDVFLNLSSSIKEITCQSRSLLCPSPNCRHCPGNVKRPQSKTDPLRSPRSHIPALHNRSKLRLTRNRIDICYIQIKNGIAVPDPETVSKSRCQVSSSIRTFDLHSRIFRMSLLFLLPHFFSLPRIRSSG
jgi:hypothetical protein